MDFENAERPIIVKRRKRNRKDAHGGAWKVAFADFATAMMAFFLVLWISEATTDEQKAAIEGYFTDPSVFTEKASPYVIDLGGGLKDDPYAEDAPEDIPDATDKTAPIVVDEDTVEELAAEIENRRLQELKLELEARIDDIPELKRYKDQIEMTVTDEGLRIQIVDAQQRPMFDSGSEDIKSYMREILAALAEVIKTVPNGLSITGHTDGAGFMEQADYTNWELSADRANAARRVLMRSGVPSSQMTQVVGLADSSLYLPDDPTNPRNRRISILVLNETAQERIKRRQQQAPNEPADTANPVDTPAEAPASAFDGSGESFESLRRAISRPRRDEVF